MALVSVVILLRIKTSIIKEPRERSKDQDYVRKEVVLPLFNSLLSRLQGFVYKREDAGVDIMISRMLA